MRISKNVNSLQYFLHHIQISLRMVHTVPNIPDIMMGLNEGMHDQRILLCTTDSTSLNMTNTINTWQVFSFISQDFLITTSQLPWPLVSRCNDGVLFSEICTGKVTRKMCNSRHSENDTKRQKRSKFDLHNKEIFKSRIHPPLPPPRMLNFPCLWQRAFTS